MILLCVDWVAISAIATALMAILTFITLMISRKQIIEQHRARLIFSIVYKADRILLRMQNIGDEVAHDIHLKFSDNFKQMLLTDGLRDNYSRLEKTSLSLDAHDSKYYYILAAKDEQNCFYYQMKGEKSEITQKDINDWHDTHDREEFEITGNYNIKYKIKENLSIDSFINVGMIFRDEIAAELHGLNTEFLSMSQEIKNLNKSISLLQSR